MKSKTGTGNNEVVIGAICYIVAAELNGSVSFHGYKTGEVFAKAKKYCIEKGIENPKFELKLKYGNWKPSKARKPEYRVLNQSNCPTLC